LLKRQYPKFTVVDNSRSMSKTFYRVVPSFKEKAGYIGFNGLPTCNSLFCLSLHTTKNRVWLNYKNYSLPVRLPNREHSLSYEDPSWREVTNFPVFQVLLCVTLSGFKQNRNASTNVSKNNIKHEFYITHVLH